MPQGRPRTWFALVLVLAAALRLLALDKPLYVDEMSTLTVATAPLASMAAVMRQIDASPALYPVLMHFWLSVSHADAWARLLSAIFGWLAVPIVALVACRLFDWRAGLATAFVAAIAPAHVHYAQYVRSYSLFTMLAALHLLLFIDLMDAGGDGRNGAEMGTAAPCPYERGDGRKPGPLTRRRILVFTLVTTALFYTHYLSLLLLPAEGLVALSRWRSRRQQTLAWMGAVAMAGVLFLPGVPLLLHNAAFDRVRNLDRPLPPPVVRLVPDLLGELSLGQRSLGFTNPQVRRITLAAAAVVFPTLVLVAVATGRRTRRDAIILLLLFAWLPVAIYIGSGRRLVAVRFFLPFMAGYLVLLGYGVASLRRTGRTIAVLILASLCAIPLWHFHARFSWSYDHRAVARAIDATSRQGDVMLFVHPYEQFYFRWYLGDRLPMRGLIFTALEDQGVYVIKPPPLDVERARARVLATAARHPRMWFIGQSTKSFASAPGAEQRLLAWMDATYARVADLGSLTGGDPIIRLYEPRR